MMGVQSNRSEKSEKSEMATMAKNDLPVGSVGYSLVCETSVQDIFLLNNFF